MELENSLSEAPVRRAINFDLDTKKMKSQKVYKHGYSDIKKFLRKHGFAHRQYSGYLSDKEMRIEEVVDIIERLMQNCPWLPSCTNKIDLTDYQQAFDLTQFVIGSDVNTLRNSLTARRQKSTPERTADINEPPNDKSVGLRQFEKDVASGKKQVNLRNGVARSNGKGNVR
ncbi:MAG: hypothetical protein NC350_00290 [Corallococcus sp.]|nr:hypothetical protein [Corallococcus sp.]